MSAAGLGNRPRLWTLGQPPGIEGSPFAIPLKVYPVRLSSNPATHMERDYTMSSATTAKATPARKPARPKSSGEHLVRLNVNLNAETAEALKEIADQRGISFTEAVRRAISVYKFIDDETHEGNRIQTVNPSRNEIREIVLM